MAVNDPFSDSLISFPAPNPRIVDPNDPFADVLLTPAVEQIPFEETAGRRFVTGFYRGFTHPVRAFTEPPPEASGLAGTVGELVGAGVSFVPFFRGAQVAVRGVGLAKMLPGFITRILEGGLSLGAYEAFAGETVSEAPSRFTEGFVTGATLEGAFVGAAAAWRKMFPKYKPQPHRPRKLVLKPITETPTEPPPVEPAPLKLLPPGQMPEPKVVAHPLALKLEMWMRPRADEPMHVIEDKLRAIGSPKEQLQATFAKLAIKHNPGGHIIVPGLNRREILQLVRAVGSEERFRKFKFKEFLSFKGSKPDDDLFDLLVVDTSRSNFGVWAIKDKLTYKEAADLIKKHFKNLNIELKEDIDKYGSRGMFVEPLTIAISRKAAEGSELSMVSTLFHEFTHFLTTRIARRRGFDIDYTTGVKVPEVFLIDLARFRQSSHRAVDFNLLLREMSDATYEVLKKKLIESGKDGIEAARIASESMKANPEYYGQGGELLSRLVELMFLDPKKAHSVAPTATRMMSRLLSREAPWIKELINTPERDIAELLTERWKMIPNSGFVSILERPPITQQQLSEFGRTGFFSGMRVIVNGKDAEFLAKIDNNYASIRWLTSGRNTIVQLKDINRPLVPDVVAHRQSIIDAVDKVLKSNPRWVAVRMRAKSRGDIFDLAQKAVVHTENFEFVEGSLREWFMGLPQGVRESMIAKYGTIKLPSNLDELKRLGAIARHHFKFLDEALDVLGKDGIVMGASYGRPVLYIKGDPLKSSAIEFASTFESRTLISDFGDFLNRKILYPSEDEFIRSILVDNHVSEVDIPFFTRIVREIFGRRIKQLADPEVREAVDRAEDAVKHLVDDTQQAAKRVAMDVVDTGKSIDLYDSETKAKIGEFLDINEVDDYVRRTGTPEVGENLGEFPGASLHGGNAGPPPFQAQIPSDLPEPEPIRPAMEGGAGGTVKKTGIGQRIADTLNIFGATFTAMENFAKSVERRGFGPAYTRVFEPVQQAILEVDRQMAEVKRAILGNISFSEQFAKVAKMLSSVPKERQELITRYIEYMSREEVAAAGGLLQRGMNENEIRIANFIEEAGLASDIPRLLMTQRLIESTLKSELTLNNLINRLRQTKLTPEAQQLLRVFETMPRFQSEDDIIKYLQLSDDEIKVLNIFKASRKVSMDKFSLYAVSRYASARPLAKGFKSGREQFAAENGMTRHEVQIAEELDKMFSAAFEISGLDPRRMLGGYWPHLRVWIKEGFVPSRTFLPPDVIEWVSQRVRTGELDVYNMDPLVTAFKHVRNMLMKQYFDPIMKSVNESLKAIKSNDRRIYEILAEYVNEVHGRPHASFGKVQRAIETSWKILTGKDAPPGVVQNVVNSLSALAASASIPFRPALIVRNYFESLIKVAPRVGINSYFKAVRYVVDPATKDEAFELAKKAKAIVVGPQRLLSIHASTEIFGPGAGPFNYKLERMLERGFRWYQSADDFGRAVAFHAQRFKMLEHLDDYVRGKINIEQFKERAKINTFDSVDADIAEQMILSGNYDGAINHLGRALSRETMNRYGHANHPAGWNSVVGRLFGQFGTWPIQYKDYLIQGITRGSMKDRAEFALLHSALSGSIVAAGAAVGLNLWSWIGFPSLAYTGGPFAEMTVDVVKSLNGSELEKQLARRNLIAQIPILGWIETGNPRSVFVPGSYLLGDIVEATKADTPIEALLEATGFNIARVQQKHALDWIYDL